MSYTIEAPICPDCGETGRIEYFVDQLEDKGISSLYCLKCLKHQTLCGNWCIRRKDHSGQCKDSRNNQWNKGDSIKI